MGYTCESSCEGDERPEGQVKEREMQATLGRLRERRQQGNEGGFTLIELLIVIVILAILAAIVVFAVQSLTGSSAKASCESDVQTVDHAVQAYVAQMGKAPTQISDLTSGPVTGSNGDQVGPWLHSTPTNGQHYEIVLADGSTAYNAWVPGTVTSPTPTPPADPPAGTPVVETWNSSVSPATWYAAKHGTLYIPNSLPANVSSGTTSPDVVATSTSAACAAVTS